MAEFQADTDQLEAFARQLAAAGHRLADLDATNAEVGRAVVAAARPVAPHGATGQLSGSLTADASANGVVWASSARYWTFVHWGAPRRNMRARPFYLEVLDADQDAIVAVYRDHATETLRNLS